MIRSGSVVVVAGLIVIGCGPSAETPRPSTATPIVTRETAYREGHQLYLLQQFDSAAVHLQASLALDSTYLPPLRDLAQLHYERGMFLGDAKSPQRTEAFRTSRTYFIRMEALGMREAEVYERICELSVALEDDRTFVRYARKSAELYPFDRQYYNLGIAYYQATDFQNVIKSQKEAKDKFPTSPYLGAFYRQLGRAYRKVDRDQTAERVFTEGVRAVDARLRVLGQGGNLSTPEMERLREDKIGMLLELKRLHQIYRAEEKMRAVDNQLREAGYDH
jgi:tetratricopeptide (TPR) repeat protein